MSRLAKFTLLAVLGVFTAASPASQPVPDPVGATISSPAARFNATARREVVAKLSSSLRDRYIFPDVGENAAANLEAALAAGRYDTLDDPSTFAQRLSADVAAVAHDKHLSVMSLTAFRPGPPQTMPRGEGGVFRADRLANDVGYIEVLGFPPRPLFKRTLDRAMAGLAGSRTLIIDVRRNGGGSPESVAYLVSFLVAPDRPINDIISRTEGTRSFTRQSYRSVPTPVSFTGAAAYVLTSKETFSGGEEFAYDVQALKRGTLVGEVTGGGANPTGMVELGHDMAAMIPFGRAENATTRSNWEGRGVRPDIVVPASDALRMALAKVSAPAATEIGGASIEQVFAPRSVPLPGSEAALRRMIAAYATGRPDYATMSPDVAVATRGQLSSLHAEFIAIGDLQSLTFNGPDMLGGDEYRLHFARGDLMMALVLGTDGKVAAISTPLRVPAP